MRKRSSEFAFLRKEILFQRLRVRDHRLMSLIELVMLKVIGQLSWIKMKRVWLSVLVGCCHTLFMSFIMQLLVHTELKSYNLSNVNILTSLRTIICLMMSFNLLRRHKCRLNKNILTKIVVNMSCHALIITFMHLTMNENIKLV